MRFSNRFFALAGLTLVISILVMSHQAFATDFTIEDGNSIAKIETKDVTAPIEPYKGNYSWTVDGVEHLKKQWFWYRIGDTQEYSIDTLTVKAESTSDIDKNGLHETLYVRYGGTGFTIEVKFILAGGQSGTGAADMTEIITINNTGAAPLDFHFFEYVDFDLRGTAEDEKVEIVGAGHNTAQQWDANTQISETVVTRAPDRYEAGKYSTTLDALTDNDLDDLLNTAGPVGPGDLTWAFQWDFTLAKGGSFLISKDKSIVPAPGAALLAVMGLGLVGTLRRRRNKA